MKENKQATLLKEAYNKGYRVNAEGKVLNSKNKELKSTPNSSGYYHFSIRYKGDSYNIPVHRLQAYQKFGNEIFKKDIVVRHHNGDCLDNSSINILIGTQSENMMDKPKEKRILEASNPIHNHKSILEDRAKGMTYKDLMLKYNISSKGTISFIINKSLEKDKESSL